MWQQTLGLQCKRSETRLDFEVFEVVRWDWLVYTQCVPMKIRPSLVIHVFVSAWVREPGRLH